MTRTLTLTETADVLKTTPETVSDCIHLRGQADALVATASKTVVAAQKEGDKLVSVAQKALDAATKKHTKVFDAAGKGRDKLNGQLATLVATPAEPAKRGPKAKAKVLAPAAT